MLKIFDADSEVILFPVILLHVVNLTDLTQLSYNEEKSPRPWHLVKSMFYCVIVILIIYVLFFPDALDASSSELVAVLDQSAQSNIFPH